MAMTPEDFLRLILDSESAARRLDRPGMAVRYRNRKGVLEDTVMTHLPWKLADGTWVVQLQGRLGGVLASHVSPMDDR